ncbi:unnamed protein product [Symbiodinium sp. CCMP2592]|nr:unnamed protein product [Symbiodinium sp. CCMP2592]
MLGKITDQSDDDANSQSDSTAACMLTSSDSSYSGDDEPQAGSWLLFNQPIELKNTFVHFSGSKRTNKRRATCPGLLQSMMTSEAVVMTGLPQSLQPAVLRASSFASHTFSPAQDAARPQDLQHPAVTPSKVKDTDLAHQRQLNKDLIAAASGPHAAFQVLDLLSKNLESMNGVNLATAIHRISRACQVDGKAGQIKDHPTFRHLLHITEKMLCQTLPDGTPRMPPKCCSVFAWSCANLGIFRTQLLARLALTAAQGLGSCEPHEVTNLLWAYASLCRNRKSKMAKGLEAALTELMKASLEFLVPERLRAWKPQILMSALVSLVALPWQPSSQQVVSDVLDALAMQQEQLVEENTRPISIFFEELRKRHAEVALQIVPATSQKWPGFMQQFAGGARKGHGRKNRKA